MSHYSQMKVMMSDEKYLIMALEAMGYKGKIELYKIAQPLYGYQGDKRPEKANIIIRRKYVGHASNDIGFEKQADGTYRAYISEYDERQGKNKKWLGNLTQNYSYLKIKDSAKKKGFMVTEKRKDDKIILTLSQY